MQQVLDATMLDPSITVDETNALVREIMTNLASNQFADISLLVDMNQIGMVMENAGYYGNIDAIDAIVDNLSDQAETYISPYTWGHVVNQVIDSQFNDPSITQSNVADLTREIMDNLSNNNLADISQLIDMSQVDLAIERSISYHEFGVVDALVDNLSDQALSMIDTARFESLGVNIGSNNGESLWDTSGQYEALYGLDGNDYVIGGSNDTSLYGGDGTDYVYDWMGGDDTISGGDGSDYLYGGQGADTFVFNQGETGVDTIWAFNSAEGDRVDISNYLEQYDPTQDAINDFVTLTEVNGNTTISVDADGQGAGTSHDIAVLNGVTGLTIDDVIDNGSLV